MTWDGLREGLPSPTPFQQEEKVEESVRSADYDSPFSCPVFLKYFDSFCLVPTT